MSEEAKPIPKVVRKLEDYPDLIDLLYAYFEFSKYIWDRLYDYNTSETSDIRTAIANVRSEIIDFLKEKLWEKFLNERRMKHD